MPQTDRDAPHWNMDLPTRKLIDALFRRAPTPNWTFQDHRDAFVLASRTRPLAPGVTIEPVASGMVTAEWAIPRGAHPAAAILYLHGGGFVMGTLGTTRPLATHLAAATGIRVLYVEYRLAPEHPYPAALDDAFAAYQWLAANVVPPGQIAIAGDSAGGGLAVATMLRLRDERLSLPCAGVCISPFFDLTLTAPSIDENAATDPQAPRWLLERMAAAYLAGSDPKAPYASPRYADLEGLPPLLIQVGSLESLRDDSTGFADRASRAGVEVTLRVWQGAIHVWHAFAPRLSLANQAFREIAGWLRPRL